MLETADSSASASFTERVMIRLVVAPQVEKITSVTASGVKILKREFVSALVI